MLSEFFYGIVYFFNEHFLIYMLFLIVGFILALVSLVSSIRVKIILSIVLCFIAPISLFPLYEDWIQMFGRSIYDIDFLARRVESGDITEEQAKKYLQIIASHNEKKREEWIQEKKQEGEKKYKEVESRIKTKEIQERLEDEYKKIVGGNKQ